MTTTQYAQRTDVALAYEKAIPAGDNNRIDYLCAQANARLTALVPSLPARISAGTVDPEVPKGLVVEAVLRVYRNPAGVSQQTTGPWSNSFSSQAAKGEIVFDVQTVHALLSPEANVDAGVGTFGLGIPASGTPFAAPVSPVPTMDADGRYIYTPEQLRGLWSQ